MKTRIALSTIVMAGGVIVLGQMSDAQVTSVSTPALSDRAVELDANPIGGQPDVHCFKIDGLSNWSDSTYRAYSVGTTSCNEGDVSLIWNGNNNQHPVIGQAMYRYKQVDGKGRFEQIGQGWLKHGFCALDQTECGPCSNGTGCISLAPGCSDPYTSGRNGSQGSAGPKYQVNATTGFFPYPPADPSYSGQTARRLRALRSDVESASNPGARYFIEAQYVHKDDAPDDNVTLAGNNASYREVNLSSTGVASSYNGNTIPKKPAIEAWKVIDPTVAIAVKKIPGEGTFRIANRAYDNGNGTWDYEYAVHNLDVDKSAGSFSVPVPAGVNVTNIGFKDVPYHSGETFSGSDWNATVSGGSITWATQTYAQNQNANAIRWGTTYNFRFTADAPPAVVSSTLGVFKPGLANQSANVKGPVPVIEEPCIGDGDDSGVVDFNDLVALLSAWGPCPGCSYDFDENNVIDFQDLVALLSAWGPCP